MNFKYLNLDSNKEVQFSVENGKSFIAIYGKNGVGKTTFSTQEYWDKNYVFNDVFVRENIYVINDKGVETSSDNKKNISSLFVGKRIVDIQKRIESLNDNKKEYLKKLDDHYDLISKKILVKIDKKDIDDVINNFIHNVENIDSTIKYDKLDDIINDFEIKSIIKDDKKFSESNLMLENLKNISTFISIVKNNDVLNSMILSDQGLSMYNDLIKKVASLKLHYESKARLDEFLKERNVDKIPDIDLIKSVLELQKNNDICFLCGSIGRLEEIKKWHNLISDKYSNEKKSLLLKFNNIIHTINQLNEFKENLNEIIPKTFIFINELKNEINNIIIKLINNDFTINSSIVKLDIEELVSRTSDLKSELIIYCIVKDYKKIIGSKYQIDNITAAIKNSKDVLDIEMSKQVENITSEVNDVLDQLQVGKKIKIKTDKSGGNYKYTFTVGDKKVDILSEGNRHKLALAFFIASINQRELKDKTIIFDDPVVALDELGYHVLRKLIINLRNKESTLKIIVLTHNIFYLYIQLSNIFNNEDLSKETSFFIMTSTQVKEFDVETLRIDDFSLFKRCLKEMISTDELLILSGIVYKIFRQFIDLSLRTQGVMFGLKDCDNIMNLNISDEHKNILRTVNSEINKITKNPNKLTLDNAKELFALLKKATDTLGFNIFITKDELEKVDTFSMDEEDKTILSELKSENVLFYIVDAVNDIIYRNKYSELLNYISHPRQQITKQITSLSYDF